MFLNRQRGESGPRGEAGMVGPPGRTGAVGMNVSFTIFTCAGHRTRMFNPKIPPTILHMTIWVKDSVQYKSIFMLPVSLVLPTT